ncbi:hypothetical protein KDL28_30965 [Pseudonocardia sp. S2-4]|uniref:Uncharacterized protein n=2 Tax=Pseudonocardia humida TaxID=2800819 RepID=A0ABT1A953_9PSEU|nr:hypothetical protein [Pseudonocardia humida]
MVNVPVMVPEDRLSDFYSMYAAWLNGAVHVIAGNLEVAQGMSETSGAVSGSDLPHWTAADGDLAREVWSKLSQPAKRLVSILVDSPDEHVGGDELAERAGIPNGRQGVAGALGWPGRYCLAVGREYFWSWEDLDGSAPGYWLTPEVAELFRAARDES